MKDKEPNLATLWGYWRGAIERTAKALEKHQNYPTKENLSKLTKASYDQETAYNRWLTAKARGSL